MHHAQIIRSGDASYAGTDDGYFDVLVSFRVN